MMKRRWRWHGHAESLRSRSLPDRDRWCPHDDLVPDLAGGRNRVHVRTLFRNDRPGQALRTASRKIVIGWPIRNRKMEEFTGQPGNIRAVTPDEEFRLRHGLLFDRSPTGRKLLRLRPYLTKTPGVGGKRGASTIVTELETFLLWLHADSTYVDSVVEVQLTKKKGRLVYIHSFFNRVVHRMVLLAIQDRADRAMSAHSHAYRPARSRLTALADARGQVRRGRALAVHVDINSFFPSVSAAQIWHAMRYELPWTTQALRWVIMNLLAPRIMRGVRTEWCTMLESAGPALLTGSILSPFLSNVVLSHFLDRPLSAALPDDVGFVRYSDNILLLGSSAASVATGVETVRELLDHVGMGIHGDLHPADVRVHRLRYLGKTLHGGSVVTPESVLTEIGSTLAQVPLESEVFRQAALRAGDELILDPSPARRLRTVARAIGSDAARVQAFRRLAEPRLARRRPAAPAFDPHETLMDDLTEEPRR